MNSRWMLGMIACGAATTGAACLAEDGVEDPTPGTAAVAKGGGGAEICTVQGPTLYEWDGSPPPAPGVYDVTVALQTIPGKWIVAQVDTKNVAIEWWVKADVQSIGPLIGELGTRELAVMPMGPPPPPPVWDGYVTGLAMRFSEVKGLADQDIAACELLIEP